MKTIALFGAAGAMGTRASTRLHGDPEFRVLHVDQGDTAIKKLRDRGIAPVEATEAVSAADVVLLAVPDHLIGKIAAVAVPKLRAGALLICLDPAAPYAGKLPPRKDVAYFVTHPSHPPVFNDETDLEAKRDYFGSGKAKQSIVCALMQGTEADYALGESISRKMFGPILRSHRVTVEQMAILEPALSETVCATCLTIIREAMDEAIRRGVPAAATRDFLLGHINVELAVIFKELDWNFSAGCQRAIVEAKPVLFQPDWKKVFDEDQLRASVARITGDA